MQCVLQVTEGLLINLLIKMQTETHLSPAVFNTIPGCLCCCCCPEQVVELGGSKVLIVGVDDDVYAVSNKCSHLGLPIVGELAAWSYIADGLTRHAHSSLLCGSVGGWGERGVMPLPCTFFRQ